MIQERGGFGDPDGGAKGRDSVLGKEGGWGSEHVVAQTGGAHGAALVSMQKLESLPRRVVCWKLFLQLFEVCVFFQTAELTQKCWRTFMVKFSSLSLQKKKRIWELQGWKVRSPLSQGSVRPVNC